MKPFKSLFLLTCFILASISFTLAQDAKANIKAAYDDLNKRDYSAFTKLVTPDFTEYAAGPEPIKTPKAAIEAYKMFFNAFPDLRIEIKDIAQGTNGRYFLKVMLTGTNTGSFGALPPTGKKASIEDVDIVEINSNGLATSHWSANPNGLMAAVGYGSLGNPNTAVISGIYEKFMFGDLPGILAACADDVVFEVHDDVLNPSPTIYKGKNEVERFFKELMEKVSYTKFQPWRFIADGEDVIVLVHAEYKHIPTGKTYNSNYVHEFKVVNGKISSFKGVADIQEPEMKLQGEKTVRDLFAAMDAGQTELFSNYLSPDFRISNPFLAEPSPVAAFQGILATQKTAFPNLKHEIVEMSSDGHYVTTRGIFHGTNTGPMMGNPPTGHTVALPFIVVDEIDANGKIKNRYVQFDSKSFDAQIMGEMKPK